MKLIRIGMLVAIVSISAPIVLIGQSGSGPGVAASPVKTWTSADGMVFVAVSGGTYRRGLTPSEAETLWPEWSSDELFAVQKKEMAPHQATLRDFWIAATELTQAQYRTIMGINPSAFSGTAAADDKPVEQVSWYDALVLCNTLSIKEGLKPVYSIRGSTDPTRWGPVPGASDRTWNAVKADWKANGYRLPTEAEWEYAARGGAAASERRALYAGGDNASELAWCGDQSNAGTRPVGTKRPNELGLHDMSGNVWEWCWDWYGAYPRRKQASPTGPSKGEFRVTRGGNWKRPDMYSRIMYRGYLDPSARNGNFGIRLARSAD